MVIRTVIIVISNKIVIKYFYIYIYIYLALICTTNMLWKNSLKFVVLQVPFLYFVFEFFFLFRSLGYIQKINETTKRNFNGRSIKLHAEMKQEMHQNVQNTYIRTQNGLKKA